MSLGFTNRSVCSEIATEAPAAVFVHREQRTDLVVAKSVGMKLLDVASRVVDQELADAVVPGAARKATGTAVMIGAVQTVIWIAMVRQADVVVYGLVVAIESAAVVVDDVEGDSQQAVDVA